MKFEAISQSAGQQLGTSVLVVFGNQLAKHPFFGFLPAAEQKILGELNQRLGGEGWRRAVALAGNKTVLVLADKNAMTHRRALLAARQVIDLARREKQKNLILNFDDFRIRREEPALLAEALATQLAMANFEFVKYKQTPANGWFFVEKIFVRAAAGEIAAVQNGLRRGAIIGEEINNSRILSNTPGGDMTPAGLAAAAIKAGRQAEFKVKVLKKTEIEKLKMGGVLGVARGSKEEPRFIVMEYQGGPKNEKPVVVIGKGVTFDTGGLNVKPENYMADMHMDMAGGAAAIHVVAALARLKAKKNIIGLVPAVENMPSGSSYRPGDLLKTMSGKTIEVLNTDAEGRIILADALHYARRYDPRLVIDIATLTGAAMRALGQRASALFATDEKISRQFQAAGETVGDLVWPLPLWEEYEEEIKGTFGDVANLSKTSYGGAITAAVFLWQFIKDLPWVHLDIAPRMISMDGEFLAKGATGAPVGLLARFLSEF